MTRVEFVKLPRPEKARILCDLAEEFYLQGRRVLILVQDDNQGMTLDKFMWVWKKDAFLPHAYDNGSHECHDESVVIVANECNPNGAQVLLLGKTCSLNFARHFAHVVDFAEIYDEKCREESRQRFKLYQENGFGPYLRE